MSLKTISKDTKIKIVKTFKKRKWSIFAFVCFLTIFIGSVSAATIFSNKKDSTIIVDEDNNFTNQYTNLSIIEELKKIKEKNNLVDFYIENNIYTYYFSEDLIQQNIINIIKKAVSQLYWFKDDVDDYNISARYYIHQGRKKVEFNIFLYNKNIPNKKFKSMFILEVY